MSVLSPRSPGVLTSFVRRAERLKDRGRIKAVTFSLVKGLAEGVAQGLEDLRVAIGLASGPSAEVIEDERARLVDDVADLDALVATLGAPPRAPASPLVADLSRKFSPSIGALEIHIVRQSRPGGEVRSVNLRAGSEESVAIWIPDERYERPPLLGVLAHEVAHCSPVVSGRLRSLSPLIRRRGEAVADLYAMAGLGPGYAWGVSEYLTGARSRRSGRVEASPSHPPWPIRIALVERFVEEIWDGEDLQRWILLRLSPALGTVGKVPNVLSSDFEDYALDAHGLIHELRSVKVGERDMRRIRGRIWGPTGLRPILAFNALVPR